MKTNACDLCGSDSFDAQFDSFDRFSDPPEQFTIARCSTCGVLRTFPAMTEDELAAYYSEEYWGTEPTNEWIRRSQAEKTAFLKTHGPKNGRILDVGSGAGYFLRALDQVRWERYAIEVGGIAAKALYDHFGANHVHHGTIFDHNFDDASFDAITFWSSLEHMNNPTGAVARAHQLLKPDGTLIVQVPNADSYQLKKFRGDWFALDAPRHRYHFSMKSLTKLLRDNGFEIRHRTFVSKEHNLHALRQSMKARYGRSVFGRTRYLMLKPFTCPFDALMSRSERGATITLAAIRK